MQNLNNVVAPLALAAKQFDGVKKLTLNEHHAAAVLQHLVLAARESDAQLVAAGAVASAVVPIVSGLLANGEAPRAWRVVSTLTNLMLVALLYLYNKSGGSFDILTWHKLPLSLPVQALLFFAFFAAFSSFALAHAALSLPAALHAASMSAILALVQ